jgi:tellurite methyltransferase
VIIADGGTCKSRRITEKRAEDLPHALTADSPLSPETKMTVNRSISFFETQFQRQVAGGEFALNPFESAVLEFVSGRVLDLGSGLGNLSLAAARRGATVTAIDASPTAVERINAVAREENLPVRALCEDLSTYAITEQYDTIIAIGLLMFFSRARALAMLSDIRRQVAPGGHAIINTLIEGTTYMDMFEPGNFCLLAPGELEQLFSGWTLVHVQHQDFAAPGNTVKAFVTLVARKDTAI